MPSNKRNLRAKRQERYQRQMEQSVSPDRSPVPDGSADENGVASHPGTTTPNIGALQLSTPASSIGSKRRSMPPKAGAEPFRASQNSVSSVGTQIASATQNDESSPRNKKGKIDDFDRPISALEAIALTPVSTQRSGGRPAKKRGGPGRGKANDSMGESSSMDQSSEAGINAAVLPNVPEKINFSTVQINFATTRNLACKIWKWGATALYECDARRSGPRFIETCWNDLAQFLNDAFIVEYLAYLASISQRKVVVVDPAVWQMGIDRVIEYKNMTFGYDPNVPAEVILLPLHFPGHWTLIVHDVQCGTHFADSLPTPYGRLDVQLTDKIIKIISDILPSTVLTGIFNAVNLTVQHDGNSCGYFVCLYAESWLMNNRTFVLPDLSINYEKKRILWHINELYGSDNVSYHPREGVPTPCPIVYLHTDEVQSTSKAAEPMELDEPDDIMIIEPQTSGKAANAILTQCQVAGENQADTLGLVSESCVPQEPIAQADDAIFVRPKTPPRRSVRIVDGNQLRLAVLLHLHRSVAHRKMYLDKLHRSLNGVTLCTRVGAVLPQQQSIIQNTQILVGLAKKSALIVEHYSSRMRTAAFAVDREELFYQSLTHIQKILQSSLWTKTNPVKGRSLCDICRVTTICSNLRVFRLAISHVRQADQWQ
ncbi:hypothetical protein niasHT_039357 [Heterodera trifolii]|uniref:Ubiquitin-like protease family profile domain-containing protein n=1 Tax=Heterodera trifolii TaxID=157864 RepID=A0ABD2ITE6_9BILA